MGYLCQNAYAVACLAVGVLARAVFERLHDGQRIRDDLMRGESLDVDDRADAAVVVLKRRVIEAVCLLLHILHIDLPFRRVSR